MADLEVIVFVVVLVLVSGFVFLLLSRGMRRDEKTTSRDSRAAEVTADASASTPETREESIDEEITEAIPPPEQVEPVALSQALEKTKSSFFGRIKDLFSGGQGLPSDELEDLEEVLYTSDLGPQTVQRLMGAIEEKLEGREKSDLETIQGAIRNEMLSIFEQAKADDEAQVLEDLSFLRQNSEGPTLWMIVGVNGAGKTTTIGKLAGRFASEGKRVLVAAGDTFRAAAGDQLRIWSDRAQVEIFDPAEIKDPSAVAFEAYQKGKSGFDVILVDTAGRLHTQKNLMEELKKMKRVLNKAKGADPEEVLLVLDANSGQNALVQAKEFHKALEVTGVVLTKMDGTAKGGVAVGLACELQIPVKLIGVGEKIEDLRRFSSKEFVDSII